MLTLKIMPVEQCGAIGKCQSSPSGYASYMSYGSSDPAQVSAHALRQLEAARAKDVETHEKNLPAIENNKVVRQRISALMTEIGMPNRWSERDRKSRSMYPKLIGHNAGYLDDMEREVKITDGFESATQAYERLKKDYEAYAKRAEFESEQKQRQAEAARQVELEKRKADMELAAILLRYGLPIETDWDGVLQALRQKDQRLDLAVAMEQTRGDWSDGPYRVSDALDRFTIHNDEDKSIAVDVASCLFDFSDGRVFRDTRWNYGALFASVADQQLSADVQAALAHASRE